MRYSSARMATAVICALSTPTPVMAIPIAEWLTPWQVVLGDKTENGNSFFGGSAQAARAFGDSARRDGQVRDTGTFLESLPGTPAIAKSESSVSSSAFAEASSSVSFQRVLQLTDAPLGWAVVLRGALVGELVVANQLVTSPNPVATVNATANILNLGFGGSAPPSVPPFSDTGIDVSFFEIQHGAGRFEEVSFPVAEFREDEGILPNGRYIVSGSLETFAQRLFRVGVGGLFNSRARSDFFADGEPGFFRVDVSARSVAAQPSVVPEPCSLAVLSAGILAMFGMLMRRRAKDRSSAALHLCLMP